MQNLVKYNNVEYFMPFLFCNDIFVPMLKELLRNEINPVKYVYGSPYCKWGTGGRLSTFSLHNLEFVEHYFAKLKNKYNVIPTLTFTNLEAGKCLKDKYSNNLLDIAYKYDCHFLVSTPKLYNHIKKRYPDSKMHCSIIAVISKFIEEKDFDETRFYNEMLDKYEVVVARPEYIIENINKLDKLFSDISRIEVLINQYCHFNCRYHLMHYKFQAEMDDCKVDIEKIKKVKYYSENKKESFELCPRNSDGYRSVFFSQEQVRQIIDIGIKKIKIQGRSAQFNSLFNELYKSFFNDEYSMEEIRLKADKICAEIIERNKKAALMLI